MCICAHDDTTTECVWVCHIAPNRIYVHGARACTCTPCARTARPRMPMQCTCHTHEEMHVRVHAHLVLIQLDLGCHERAPHDAVRADALRRGGAPPRRRASARTASCGARSWHPRSSCMSTRCACTRTCISSCVWHVHCMGIRGRAVRAQGVHVHARAPCTYMRFGAMWHTHTHSVVVSSCAHMHMHMHTYMCLVLHDIYMHVHMYVITARKLLFAQLSQ